MFHLSLLPIFFAVAAAFAVVFQRESIFYA